MTSSTYPLQSNPKEGYTCYIFLNVLMTQLQVLSHLAVKYGKYLCFCKTLTASHANTHTPTINGCPWMWEGRWASEEMSWNRMTLKKETALFLVPTGCFQSSDWSHTTNVSRFGRKDDNPHYLSVIWLENQDLKRLASKARDNTD